MLRFERERLQSAPHPALVILAAGRARRFGGCKPLAPVGPDGGAIIDFLASDALAAGYRQVVLVLNPDTGPLLREHVRRTWPEALSVAFTEQATPSGTVDAVLAARELLDPAVPFAVANADDIYGAEALAVLARTLVEGQGEGISAGAPWPVEHAMVAFRLRRTIVSDGHVNRGICEVDQDGFLVRLDERRDVGLDASGGLASGDGRQPAVLAPDAPAAMNLWGFQPAIWDLFEAEHAAREREKALGSAGGEGELLIPEVVGAALARESAAARVRVVVSDGDCFGVTHPGDLEIVQARLALEIAAGSRPELLWPLDAPCAMACARDA